MFRATILILIISISLVNVSFADNCHINMQQQTPSHSMHLNSSTSSAEKSAYSQQHSKHMASQQETGPQEKIPLETASNKDCCGEANCPMNSCLSFSLVLLNSTPTVYSKHTHNAQSIYRDLPYFFVINTVYRPPISQS